MFVTQCLTFSAKPDQIPRRWCCCCCCLLSLLFWIHVIPKRLRFLNFQLQMKIKRNSISISLSFRLTEILFLSFDCLSLHVFNTQFYRGEKSLKVCYFDLLLLHIYPDTENWMKINNIDQYVVLSSSCFFSLIRLDIADIASTRAMYTTFIDW